MRNISIILKHNNYSDSFKVFVGWLKSYNTQNKPPGSLNLPDKINLEITAMLNNPSFRFINPEGESVKIDDIRKFKQELSFSSYDSKKRYFIFFNADSTTLQAQNALLKSIEEPPINTQIVLLTSTLDKLIPTIISRCQVVSLKETETQKNQSEVEEAYQKILNSKHYELIELAGTYKERKDALIFLNSLLNYLNSQLHNENSKQNKIKLAKHLKILLEAIDLLNKNINIKLALENCFFDFL